MFTIASNLRPDDHYKNYLDAVNQIVDDVNLIALESQLKFNRNAVIKNLRVNHCVYIDDYYFTIEPNF